MATVDWHEMMNSNEQDTSLLTNFAADFEASTLSLSFSASLEYIGKSADGNFDDDFNLGTTYWIDFQSFSSVDGGVNAAGNCGNRRSADYSGLDFAEMWEYPANPADLESVSTADRMAYPPSDWTLNAVNCTTIKYDRSLSWTDLSSCQDAAGNDLIEIVEDDDTVRLKGTFFVELVSPYSMTTEGYYRTFPLIQQGFEIVLNKQIDVVSSTGVQLFIPSVMAYGRDDNGNYEVTVLIQSADYVMLSVSDVAAVSAPSGVSVSDIGAVNDGCLSASSFTCGQIFTMQIDASCSDDGAVDLSGLYQFAFSPQCRFLDDGTTTDPVCDTFMTTLDESAGKVALEVDASFVDQCDVDLFEITFDGEMAFFVDEQFAVAVDGDSDPFVIGQDVIYGKVTVNFDGAAAAIANVEGVSVETVFVCTAATELTMDSPDGVDGLGGCLSTDVDADALYNVIGEGAVPEYEGTTYDATAANEATFSFLTFDTPRDTIYVHVQVLLTMTTESGGRRRRRMLLQSGGGDGDDEANQFRSYVGTASVEAADDDDDDSRDGVDGTDGGDGYSVGFVPAMIVFTAWIWG